MKTKILADFQICIIAPLKHPLELKNFNIYYVLIVHDIQYVSVYTHLNTYQYADTHVVLYIYTYLYIIYIHHIYTYILYIYTIHIHI